MPSASAGPRRTRRTRQKPLTLALVGAAMLAAGCGGGGNPRSSPTTASRGTSPPPAAAGAATCPLTGLPAPGGKVPPRPALAVKVDNAPAARPPAGLGAADVVYEQPVEGGLTRFIVIYQCHDAARVEPVRSGRLIDPEILSQFGPHPLFAYAGGIDPVITAVRASAMIDVGVSRAPSAYSRDPARQAPHNLRSSTSALYAAGAAEGAGSEPPEPVFRYGPLPGHRPASAVRIAFSGSQVTWTWDPGASKWSRRYADTGPATLADGGQIATANVVVMKVVLFPSPYVEDPTGARQNLLMLTGSGPAEVFRDGAVIDGSWQRPSLAENTELVSNSGRRIPLTPGQTWVELVPTTVNVTVTR